MTAVLIVEIHVGVEALECRPRWPHRDDQRLDIPSKALIRASERILRSWAIFSCPGHEQNRASSRGADFLGESLSVLDEVIGRFDWCDALLLEHDVIPSTATDAIERAVVPMTPEGRSTDENGAGLNFSRDGSYRRHGLKCFRQVIVVRVAVADKQDSCRPG